MKVRKPTDLVALDGGKLQEPKPAVQVGLETIVFNMENGTSYALNFEEDILAKDDIPSALLWICFRQLTHIYQALSDLADTASKRPEMPDPAKMFESIQDKLPQIMASFVALAQTGKLPGSEPTVSIPEKPSES